MVGHALVISSTVQLHILVFSDDEVAISSSRGRLEKNYLVLCSLQSLWRAMDHTFGRFVEFHQACERARSDMGESSTSPFRLDKWMCQFLMEYSKPVSRREFEIHDYDLQGPSGWQVDIQQDSDGFGDIQTFRGILDDLGVSTEYQPTWNYVLGTETLRRYAAGDIGSAWDDKTQGLHRSED